MHSKRFFREGGIFSAAANEVENNVKPALLALVILELEKMGCRRTGSFLDLPLILGCHVINFAKSLLLQRDNCRLKI